MISKKLKDAVEREFSRNGPLVDISREGYAVRNYTFRNRHSINLWEDMQSIPLLDIFPDKVIQEDYDANVRDLMRQHFLEQIRANQLSMFTMRVNFESISANLSGNQDTNTKSLAHIIRIMNQYEHFVDSPENREVSRIYCEANNAIDKRKRALEEKQTGLWKGYRGSFR